MEFITRNVESNFNNTNMKDTDNTTSRHGRSLSTQKNKYINISITELAAELEAPPTVAPVYLAPPTTLASPTPQSDSSSSIYSRTPSSRCRDYKNFLAGKLGRSTSSKPCSRATSTTSKKSTREFMSSMSAYPWITGTSSGLTSSAASATSSRRDGKSSSKEAKRGDAAPVAFQFLSGCV